MRFLDIFFSIIILILITPILISFFTILFLFNKKIFFFLKRVGKNGVKFKLIKFSTIKKRSKSPFKEKFSFLGKFLRRSSIDELPQLFNVLKGEMSLVGPRPLPRNIEKKIPKKYLLLRRSILPGITGLSQINFKGKKRSLISKVKIDIKYIYKKNLVNYLKIICITPIYILFKYKKNKTGFTL